MNHCYVDEDTDNDDDNVMTMTADDDNVLIDKQGLERMGWSLKKININIKIYKYK